MDFTLDSSFWLRGVFLRERKNRRTNKNEVNSPLVLTQANETNKREKCDA
jgi:hypothetical protein